MYNNEQGRLQTAAHPNGGQHHQQQQEMDLLSAVVNEAIVADGDHELLVSDTDFARLVESMGGEDQLLGDFQQVLQQQQQQPPAITTTTTSSTQISAHPNLVTINPPQPQPLQQYRAIQPALPPAIAQKSTPSPPKSIQIQQQQTVFFSTSSVLQPQQPQTISTVNQRSTTALPASTASSPMPIIYLQPQQQQQTIIASSSASVQPFTIGTPLSPASGSSAGAAGAQVIQIAGHQKLIPVSRAVETGTQRVIQLPANVRLAPAPVQIASANVRPAGGSQQIKLAPATAVATSQQSGQRTILLKTVKQQPNMQFISFMPASSGTSAGTTTTSNPAVVHPITNQQTTAKMIATGPTTQKTGGSHTLKPNMVHLMPANFASATSSNSGGQPQFITAQKVVQLPSTNTSNTIKIQAQPRSQGPSSATTSKTIPIGGKPTSIWMLPKHIKVEGGGMGVPSSGTFQTIQLQATPKPYITSQLGYQHQNFGTSSSKFVPIAPHPSSAQHHQFTQPLYLKTEGGFLTTDSSGGGGGGSGKITVVKIPSSLQGHSSNTGDQMVSVGNLGTLAIVSSNPSASSSAAVSAPSTNSASSASTSAFLPLEETRRKPCNCTRSQCLKLYCDCFANGEFCHNCNCVSCCNNLANEETRQKAIRLCLERNPHAFHPKIGQATTNSSGISASNSTSAAVEVERKHTKGCCCKRSGCLKNYCECYEAKILCSDRCKCVGCKNFEESSERKSLMYVTESGEMVVRSASSGGGGRTVKSEHDHHSKKFYGSFGSLGGGPKGAGGGGAVQLWGPEMKLKLPVKVKADCHPFNIFTDEILEATASCLMAQGEEGEFENYSEENIQGLILDQFGECLSQILNMAASNGVDDDLSDDENKSTSASGSVAGEGNGKASNATEV